MKARTALAMTPMNTAATLPSVLPSFRPSASYDPDTGTGDSLSAGTTVPQPAGVVIAPAVASARAASAARVGVARDDLGEGDVPGRGGGGQMAVDGAVAQVALRIGAPAIAPSGCGSATGEERGGVTLLNWTEPDTGRGATRVVLVPSPSWPLEPIPQQYARLVVVTAQVYRLPASISRIESPPMTAAGKTWRPKPRSCPTAPVCSIPSSRPYAWW